MLDTLRFAISQDKIDVVKKLLSKGVNPNWKCSKYNISCLELAVRKGNAEMIELMIPTIIYLSRDEVSRLQNYCIGKGNIKMLKLISVHHLIPTSRKLLLHIFIRQHKDIALYTLNEIVEKKQHISIDFLQRYILCDSVDTDILKGISNAMKSSNECYWKYYFISTIEVFLPYTRLYGDIENEKVCIDLLLFLSKKLKFEHKLFKQLITYPDLMLRLNRLKTSTDVLFVFTHQEGFPLSIYVDIFTNILGRKYGVFFLLKELYHMDILRSILSYVLI